MAINNTAIGLKSQIEDEIRQFLIEQVEVSDGYKFSQYKLVRRIGLFESHTYPTGKFDSQGNYKFWFDIITPRIDSEVKNIDFDTRDITVYSPRKLDELPSIITNLKLRDYLRETGQAEEINGAIEEGSSWGNVVWKKVNGTYERVDLKNFYVINQTAQHLDETPVIERHQLSQSDVRQRMGKWDNIKETLENCATETYKTEIGSLEKSTTVPYYEIYERNGEVCVKDLKEAQGLKPSSKDENRYVFAKVIAVGTKGSISGVDIKYILFAEEMKGKKNSKIFKEYHRSRYKGRWFREGLIELLFDCQVRSNQIGNQIAQGLEFASKQFFATEDKLIVQNILTDLKNGDIIRAKNFQHIEVRMSGFDQLINEYNRIINIANDIANSREIVQGNSLPSGTPFRLGALYDANANKLFDFLREKLAIPLSEIFEEWIVPDLISEMKAEEVLRLTGESDMLRRLQELIVDDWYLTNLIAIGPHSPEEGLMLKSQKMEELTGRSQLLMEGVKDLFESFKPHVSVEITGENSRKGTELETLSTFIGLEMDPVRRSHLIEKAMKRSGMDVGDLPRTPPQQLAPQPPQGEPAVVQ